MHRPLPYLTSAKEQLQNNPLEQNIL